MTVLVKGESAVTESARERMVRAAVEGLRRQGVAGMSFTEVLARSGAARGAIYHHFPGGKAQLVAEAARRNAGEVRDRLATLPAESPLVVAEAFLAAVRPVVAASAEGAGCAVAAVTVGPDADGLRELANTAFTSWVDELAGRLRVAGLAAGAATDLATSLVVLLEGAHVLCRAAGSVEPFERVARTVLAGLRDRTGETADHREEREGGRRGQPDQERVAARGRTAHLSPPGEPEQGGRREQ